MEIALPARPQSLRDLQRSSLERLLNLSYKDFVWKVLIFDRMGANVIGASMKKLDLRDCGVTLYLRIDSERSAIPDTPAIYFIEPTQANIDIVIADMKNGLYQSAHVNFSPSISRETLEYFAYQACKSGVTEMISQVFDQYLNFVPNEGNMFSLNIADTFSIFNDPIKENLINPTIDGIVKGLYSVLLTMQAVPIIRCPKDGPAEAIAESLDQKLRDLLNNSRSQKLVNTFAKRPLLIILDRTTDISPMISHSWTYQALVHDLLTLKQNKVTIKSAQKTETYDLDSKDFFWAKNSSKPFPQVAENVDTELVKYREEAAEIVKRTGVDNLDDLDQSGGISSTTGHLSWAMGQLPELSNRKKIIDTHFNILTALLERINQRKIDNYFQLEESVTKIGKQQMLKIIEETPKDNMQDLLRFFILWYLSVDDVSRKDMGIFENALRQVSCDLSALSYVKRIRELTKMTMMTSTATTPQTSGKDLFKGLGALSSKISERFREVGLSSQIDSLVSGVKSLIPGRKDLTLSRITEALMDPSMSGSYTKAFEYLYFDPKIAKVSMEKSRAHSRHVFQDAIIFVVGGGNYLEYGNLQDWAERHSQPNNPKTIIYGSTELLSPQEFLDELAQISN